MPKDLFEISKGNATQAVSIRRSQTVTSSYRSAVPLADDTRAALEKMEALLGVVSPQTRDDR